MADELRISDKPALDSPVLIAAFRGWNDGGQGASLAAGYLARLWDAQQIADVDPEGFFDFQATRPQVKLVDGLTRQIDWPETVFYHARVDGLDRDVVLLLGMEPNLRWRAFTDMVTGFAEDLGVELMITLGSLLADIPHTRPSPVTGSASDEELVEQRGLPSASLWAAVPHYVSLTPSPRAALALCERLGDILGVEIDVEELREAAEGYAEQVTRAVAADSDTQAYVEDLERRADEFDEEDIPSGEALAAELTRFLRERDRKNGEPPAATDQ